MKLVIEMDDEKGLRVSGEEEMSIAQVFSLLSLAYEAKRVELGMRVAESLESLESLEEEVKGDEVYGF